MVLWRRWHKGLWLPLVDQLLFFLLSKRRLWLVTLAEQEPQDPEDEETLEDQVVDRCLQVGLDVDVGVPGVAVGMTTHAAHVLHEQ